jgi:hypothetical protein
VWLYAECRYAKCRGAIKQHIFAFSLIIEGTTQKALQFVMPLKTSNNKNFRFIEKNVFDTTLRLQP